MSPAEKKAIERNMKLRCFLAALLLNLAAFLILFLLWLVIGALIPLNPLFRPVVLIVLMILSALVSRRLCYTKRITDFIYWR